MTDEPRTIMIAGLALVRDRKMLLVRKRGLSALILPGGKVEGDELVYLTLQRELQEELGTKLKRTRVEQVGLFTGQAAGEEPGVQVKINLMTGELEGEPVASGEIEELVWVDLDDYEDLDLAPSLRLSILPYVAGTLPHQAGLPWRPMPNNCRACSQTLPFNCRECHPGEEDLCDSDGCAAGRATMAHNVPLIRTDPVDVYGGRRVLELVGALEDRIIGPGYVLVSGADYAALVKRATEDLPVVTWNLGPDTEFYDVYTSADGRIEKRGRMTAAEAASLGPAGPVEAPEDVRPDLSEPLRRSWSSGPSPSVQAVPRTAPHLARLFDRSDAAIGPRTVHVAYDGSDLTYLPAGDHPFSRQLYAGNVARPGHTGDSPGAPEVAGGYTAPVAPDQGPGTDTLEEPRSDVWTWILATALAVAALIVLWNYVFEPLIFT